MSDLNKYFIKNARQKLNLKLLSKEVFFKQLFEILVIFSGFFLNIPSDLNSAKNCVFLQKKFLPHKQVFVTFTRKCQTRNTKNEILVIGPNPLPKCMTDL
jgi:hypothetical protein